MTPQSQPQPQNLDALLRALDDLRRIEAQVMDQLRAKPQAGPRPGWPIRRVSSG